MKRILEEPEPESDTEPEAEKEPTQETAEDQSSLNTINIYIIGATSLIQLARKPKHTIFAVTIANIKKALTPKKYTNPTTKVLLKYYKHLIAFSQKKANKLLKC